MRAVATDGARLVAVGWVDRESPMGADPTAAFWWSDDGEMWTRILSARGPLDDVAFTDDTFYASGQSSHDQAATSVLWRSDDGATWELAGDAVNSIEPDIFFHSVGPMPSGSTARLRSLIERNREGTSAPSLIAR